MLAEHVFLRLASMASVLPSLMLGLTLGPPLALTGGGCASTGQARSKRTPGTPLRWGDRLLVHPAELPPLPASIPHITLPIPPAEHPRRPPAPARISIRPVAPDDWQGTGQLFLRIAEVSPTAYQLELGGALPPDAAESLLGPILPWPAQRRPWATTLIGEGTEPQIVDRAPSRIGAPLLVEAELAARAGHAEDARLRLVELNSRDPEFGAGWLARADAEVRAGDLLAARGALEEATARGSLDPYLPTLGAEFALRAGDRREARRLLGRAFTLYPGYPAARALVELVTGRPFTWKPFRFRARVLPLERGRVLVQADTRRSGAWLTWALCQATTRFEVERTLLPFDDPPDGVRLRRELACALALADAATSPVGVMGTETHGLADPELHRLKGIAEAGFLGELTLYEIIAPRFPALLLHLSHKQRDRLAAYIDRWVLPPRLQRVDN